MEKKQIILIGGGGHCTSVIDVIEQENKYQIAGILDLKGKKGQKILDYPIIGDDNDIMELVKAYENFHITLGFIRNPGRRIEIFEELKACNIKMPAIVSPHAYVSKHASIGSGSVIMHHAQINAGSVIGENCIINSKALIEHNVSIGRNSHVSTGSIVNGNVEVGEASFIGSGAIIIQEAIIPANAFVKAGTLFVR